MQAIEEKLDSISETVITIPYGDLNDSDSEDDEPGPSKSASGSFPCAMFTPPELAERDLPDGAYLRMAAYEDAFKRCRERAQDILRKIHAPTVQRVVDTVRDAYRPHEAERFISYTELPAVAISGTDKGATVALLDDVRRVLLSSGSKIDAGSRDEDEDEDEDENDDDEKAEGNGEEGVGKRTPMLVSTLTPADCSNLTSAFKALIGGFLAAEPNGEDGKAQARPLALYDMNLLEAWFDRVRKTRDEADLPKLVIQVTDVEKIEPAIMQDIFYICSLHIPRLPLVFILGLSSPPTPSYLHATYPRTTLALLRLTRVEVQSGVEMLERVLLETFFAPEFSPTIALSPSTLDFVIEQFTRNAQSIDFVISVLQLILLRHYIEPLTVLAADELLGEKSIEDAAVKLTAPAARPFLESLLARLHHPEKVRASGVDDGDVALGTSPRKSKGKGKEKEKETCWRAHTSLEALKLMREVREVHERRGQSSRVAFRICLEVRRHLIESGVLKGGTDNREGSRRVDVIEMMGACLRGTLEGREGKVLANGIRKLTPESLEKLLSSLYALVHALPSPARSADLERDAMTRLVEWVARLGIEDADATEVAIEVEEWLLGYIRHRMRDFTEANLWDIWYTGNPQGIVELFNPAPRAAIINALVHPERYLGDGDDVFSAKKRRAPMAEVEAEKLEPGLDTGLLFRFYLESGRMVNVYDLFSAFSGTLDGQRAGARRRRKAQARELIRIGVPDLPDAPTRPSPSKGRGRGRGRGKGRGRGRGRGSRGGNKGRVGAVSESDNDGKDEENEESDGGIDESPEAKERWEAEIQARFIRSVQELDFLGFVKHTGRKPDHFQKTVYDLPEW